MQSISKTRVKNNIVKGGFIWFGGVYVGWLSYLTSFIIIMPILRIIH